MSPQRKIMLAAFDLDGTLLNSADSIVFGVTECWKVCGFPVPKAQDIKKIIGLPWEESVKNLLPDAGKKEFNLIKKYYEEVAQGKRQRPKQDQDLFPGVYEMLKEVREAGYILTIITSRSGVRLRELLARHGIEELFSALKTTDDGPGKPNPFLMRQTLNEFNVLKNNAVMIGDTTFDIAMSKNAGTFGVGVSWGVHNTSDLMTAGAHEVVHTVDEIVPTLRKLIPI